MPRYFVYKGATYYPSAEVVEADSPQAALGEYDLSEAAAVFPADAVLAVRPNTSDWDREDPAVEALANRDTSA